MTGTQRRVNGFWTAASGGPEKLVRLFVLPKEVWTLSPLTSAFFGDLTVCLATSLTRQRDSWGACGFNLHHSSVETAIPDTVAA